MSVRERKERQEEEKPEIIVDVDELKRKELKSGLESMMEDTKSIEADDTDFTGLSNIQHGHGLHKGEGKHDIRPVFGVRDEFIEKYMVSMPNDHTAPRELSKRESEFRSANEDIFRDTHNNDARRWEKINNFANSSRAPVPTESRKKLESAIEQAPSPE